MTVVCGQKSKRARLIGRLINNIPDDYHGARDDTSVVAEKEAPNGAEEGEDVDELARRPPVSQ